VNHTQDQQISNMSQHIGLLVLSDKNVGLHYWVAQKMATHFVRLNLTKY